MRPRRAPPRASTPPASTVTPVPTNAASTSPADSPMATTARNLSACAPSPPRSRSLFRPPAMSTTCVEPPQRALGRVRVRGLGVVDVPHARDLTHQLDTVRKCARSARARRRSPRRRAPAARRGGGRGPCVQDVVRPAAGRDSHDTSGSAARRARPRRDRRALTISTSSAPLVLEDAGLGGGVGSRVCRASRGGRPRR